MMLFKACPKCRGDLRLEYDPDSRWSPELVCLQCGRTVRVEIRTAPSLMQGNQPKHEAGPRRLSA
jgi:uncharacterized protein YbaR (Trm112 family)